MNYCRRCGTKIAEVAKDTYRCESGHTLFAHSLPTVGLLLVNEADEVLIAVRGIEPGKGTFGIPGGFLDIGETLEEGLAREVEEEIGVAPHLYETPQFLCSGIDLYDYDGETRTNVASMFWSRASPRCQPSAKDEVASIRWIPLAVLNPDDFFFPAIQKAAYKLKELLP